MTKSAPDPRPYELGTSREVGILLVHGFTGSPTETRPLADFIRASTEWRCKAVLLPGHGTTIEELERTPAEDWIGEVEKGYRELTARCSLVFLVGTSMGAVLCCHVALNHVGEAKLAGIVLMAPSFALRRRDAIALPFARYLKRRKYKGDRAVHYFLKNALFSYSHIPVKKAVEVMRLGKEALRRLDSLRALPMLLLAGTLDRTVCVNQIRKTAGTRPWIQFLELPSSRHILPVEPDRQTVFNACLRFMKECLHNREAHIASPA